MYVRRSRQAAAQTKHVFDELGTAAEIPEQGKVGTLIGSYPSPMVASNCFRLITVAPTFRVISSPNPAVTRWCPRRLHPVARHSPDSPGPH